MLFLIARLSINLPLTNRTTVSPRHSSRLYKEIIRKKSEIAKKKRKSKANGRGLGGRGEARPAMSNFGFDD